MGEEAGKCPKRGSAAGQIKRGVTCAGSRRWYCKACRYKYTPNRKKRAYTEAERKEALRLLLPGNSGRAVGKAFRMCQANAYRWAGEAEKIPGKMDKPGD